MEDRDGKVAALTRRHVRVVKRPLWAFVSDEAVTLWQAVRRNTVGSEGGFGGGIEGGFEGGFEGGSEGGSEGGYERFPVRGTVLTVHYAVSNSRTDLIGGTEKGTDEADGPCLCHIVCDGGITLEFLRCLARDPRKFIDDDGRYTFFQPRLLQLATRTHTHADTHTSTEGAAVKEVPLVCCVTGASQETFLFIASLFGHYRAAWDLSLLLSLERGLVSSRNVVDFWFRGESLPDFLASVGAGTASSAGTRSTAASAQGPGTQGREARGEAGAQSGGLRSGSGGGVDETLLLTSGSASDPRVCRPSEKGSDPTLWCDYKSVPGSASASPSFPFVCIGSTTLRLLRLIARAFSISRTNRTRVDGALSQMWDGHSHPTASASVSNSGGARGSSAFTRAQVEIEGAFFESFCRKTAATVKGEKSGGAREAESTSESASNLKGGVVNYGEWRRRGLATHGALLSPIFSSTFIELLLSPNHGLLVLEHAQQLKISLSLPLPPTPPSPLSQLSREGDEAGVVLKVGTYRSGGSASSAYFLLDLGDGDLRVSVLPSLLLSVPTALHDCNLEARLAGEAHFLTLARETETETGQGTGTETETGRASPAQGVHGRLDLCVSACDTHRRLNHTKLTQLLTDTLRAPGEGRQGEEGAREAIDQVRPELLHMEIPDEEMPWVLLSLIFMLSNIPALIPHLRVVLLAPSAEQLQPFLRLQIDGLKSVVRNNFINSRLSLTAALLQSLPDRTTDSHSHTHRHTHMMGGGAGEGRSNSSGARRPLPTMAGYEDPGSGRGSRPIVDVLLATSVTQALRYLLKTGDEEEGSEQEDEGLEIAIGDKQILVLTTPCFSDDFFRLVTQRSPLAVFASLPWSTTLRRARSDHSHSSQTGTSEVSHTSQSNCLKLRALTTEDEEMKRFSDRVFELIADLEAQVAQKKGGQRDAIDSGESSLPRGNGAKPELEARSEKWPHSTSIHRPSPLTNSAATSADEIDSFFANKCVATAAEGLHSASENVADGSEDGVEEYRKRRETDSQAALFMEDLYASLGRGAWSLDAFEIPVIEKEPSSTDSSLTMCSFANLETVSGLERGSEFEAQLGEAASESKSASDRGCAPQSARVITRALIDQYFKPCHSIMEPYDNAKDDAVDETVLEREIKTVDLVMPSWLHVAEKLTSRTDQQSGEFTVVPVTLGTKTKKSQLAIGAPVGAPLGTAIEAAVSGPSAANNALLASLFRRLGTVLKEDTAIAAKATAASTETTAAVEPCTAIGPTAAIGSTAGAAHPAADDGDESETDDSVMKIALHEEAEGGTVFTFPRSIDFPENHRKKIGKKSGKGMERDLGNVVTESLAELTLLQNLTTKRSEVSVTQKSIRLDGFFGFEQLAQLEQLKKVFQRKKEF